jgi:hypothetical protein
MKREGLATALAETDALGRDVAELVINGDILKFGVVDATNFLRVGRDAVIARLNWLARRGLITLRGGLPYWAAGPVSDFFAVRIAENWS